MDGNAGCFLRLAARRDTDREAGVDERCSTMGWERRGSGNYYYRKRRVGGRVVTEYVGKGLAAELGTLIYDQTRTERELERSVQEKARAEEEEIDQAMDELEKLVQAITRGYLIAQGYHTHKGQWRHKRDKKK